MTETGRSRTARLGEAALWSGACVVVLTAHLAGAAVLLRQEPADAGDAAPPAAIMIELAPEPEAAAVDETVASDQLQDSEEVKNQSVEPVTEPPPEPQPIPQPVPDPPQETAESPPEPQPEPVIEEKPMEEAVQETTQTIPEPEPEPEPNVPEVAESLALLDNVEVPLPMVRPKAVEPPKQQRKADPVPKKVVERAKPKPPAPAAKASTQARAEVKQSDRTAAAATSDAPASSSISPARWQSKLAAHLGRRGGKCPSSSRNSTAYVTFRMDRSGNLSSVSLTRSSGSEEFDRYMVDLVRRASPVPAPPPGISDRVTVPLGYRNC